MITRMTATTISEVSKALVNIREQGGAVALGRVLTLVIQTREIDIESAIKSANDASREHPCRIIVLSEVSAAKSNPANLDAEIRVGGDAGASEVIVLRASGMAASDPELLVTGLLLPDAPVVAWWPGTSPVKISSSPIGRIATRRITDAAVQANPHQFLKQLAKEYSPGDSDFAWTRLTLWRAQLAAVLDQPPYDVVTAVEVTGAPNSPSTSLLAAWLGLKLKLKVSITSEPRGKSISGIKGVKLIRKSGNIEIVRRVPDIATLIQPTQPTREISLPRRSDRDCLSEDLRRLDPDELFGKVIKWYARS
ncbi:MAG: glucose-6-phosphate dehydrogenase assembly protein OpcA [Rhodoluna sp.]|nr:glucose-6-phosphate dehydrogenase assembly protein OpcA [Rhodoluna sp.]